MWRYKSPIGTLYIVQKPNGYFIRYDNEFYGAYSSPVAAADDVYSKTTGCDEWDLSDVPDIDIPTDIFEWEKC
jgi:hypothetical protein